MYIYVISDFPQWPCDVIYTSWSNSQKSGWIIKASSYSDQVVFRRKINTIELTLLLSYINKICVLFLTIFNCIWYSIKQRGEQSPGFWSQFPHWCRLSLQISFEYQTTQLFWSFCFFSCWKFWRKMMTSKSLKLLNYCNISISVA